MSKIVMIVVLLVLMGGGGLGGAGLMGVGPLAKYMKPEDKPAEEAKATPPQEPPFKAVDVETFGIPVFEGNSVRSRLFVNFSLHVEPEAGPQVAAHLPRVQSAVLQDLMTYLPKHLDKRKKPDPEIVQQRVLKVSRRVSGPHVRGVVIKAMFER